MKELALAFAVLLAGATPAPAGKFTVRCGDLEFVFVVGDEPWRPKIKFDAYFRAEDFAEAQKHKFETKDNDGRLFMDGEPCVVLKRWICPAEREC
jgi:hypothetical protein